MSDTNLPPGFSRIDEILDSSIKKMVKDSKLLVEPDEDEIALRVKSQPLLRAAATDIYNHYVDQPHLPHDLFLALKVAIEFGGGTTR